MSDIESLPVVSGPELRRATAGRYQETRWNRANLVRAVARSARRAQALNGVLLLLLLLVGTAGYRLADKTRIIPYVVEIDATGRVTDVGPANELADPDRRVLLHALTLWITQTRTVTLDRRIQIREIRSAYHYTTGRAIGLLNGWYQQHPPFARAETETVTVSVDEVESVLALDDSLNRWRIEWTEEVRALEGTLRRRETWQALVTVTVDPPEHVEEVVLNPLGIRVTDFDWTRIASRKD